MKDWKVGEISLLFEGDVKFLPVGKILLLESVCEVSHTGRISVAKALWDFPLFGRTDSMNRHYTTFSPASLTNLS